MTKPERLFALGVDERRDFRLGGRRKRGGHRAAGYAAGVVPDVAPIPRRGLANADLGMADEIKRCLCGEGQAASQRRRYGKHIARRKDDKQLQQVRSKLVHPFPP